MKEGAQNVEELTPDQQQIEEAREKYAAQYAQNAADINEGMGFFERHLNPMDALDAAQDDANAIEHERQARQETMDQEAINKLRNKLAETYIGIDEDTGPNSVLAKKIDLERMGAYDGAPLNKVSKARKGNPLTRILNSGSRILNSSSKQDGDGSLLADAVIANEVFDGHL